jgi:hypothetical protein
MALFTQHAPLVFDIEQNAVQLKKSSMLLDLLYRFPHGELLVSWDRSRLRKWEPDHLRETERCVAQFYHHFVDGVNVSNLNWNGLTKRAWGKDELTDAEKQQWKDANHDNCTRGGRNSMARDGTITNARGKEVSKRAHDLGEIGGVNSMARDGTITNARGKEVSKRAHDSGKILHKEKITNARGKEVSKHWHDTAKIIHKEKITNAQGKEISKHAHDAAVARKGTFTKK